MSRMSFASNPEAFKTEARALRDQHAARGEKLSHAAALEAVAHSHGYRDWNTASAAAATTGQCPVTLGQNVTGTYLKQPFTAKVIGTSMLPGGQYYRVTLHFDAPVDVVSFESFSALRQRVSCRVDAKGTSPDCTSDGQPHVQLDMAPRHGKARARA